nr:hypothetical protein [Tanacetum cinerariifolium]
MSYLSDFEEINGGYFAFGRNPKGGKITGKDTECIVLSPAFKLPDENQVLLKVPRENNMYNVDLKNIVPSRDLTYLFAKTTLDESNLWHRRLGHINFKKMNKLLKGNLVRGLPSKVFENTHTCVACKKGKQHRASCKTKPVSSVSHPLQRLHKDLFGTTFVKSLNKKSYCLVVTDDYSRFTWVFFLSTKDETSPILKTFITGIENQLSLKVKIIKSDNGTEFKNQYLNQFCGMKGIKREFSVPRTPQQNGIAKKKNKTLIEAARTMLGDPLLPISFWAEAVNTACYVQNRVLVTKPHNKTPYELLIGRTPSIGFIRAFGCPVTILNNLDPLGKFDGKTDEGFLVGYSVSRNGPTWLFDIDTLTKSMNYQPVIVGNQSNPSAGVQEQFDAEKARDENVQKYVLFPLWSSGSKDPQNTDGDATFEVKEPEFEVEKPESKVHVSPSSSAKTKKHDDKTKREAKGKSLVEFTNTFSAAGPSNTAVSLTHGKSSYVDTSQYTDDPNMPALKDITYFDDEEYVGAEADFTNLETTITVSPIPTTRVHKDHHVTQIIGDLSLATQTRSMTRVVKDQGELTQINNEDFHTCMFACFLSQEDPKRVFRNKKDERGIIVKNKARLVTQGHTEKEGIDYEKSLLQLPRIEVIRLFLAYASFMGFMVYQMDVKIAFLYETIKEEVYVYQPPGFEDPVYPDKRGKVDQSLFIKKQKGDILLVQVYVDDIIFGSTNKDLCKAFEKLMKDKFQMSSMGELTFFLGIQVKRKPYGIFISQDKYVAESLRKFGLTDGKSASTPIDTKKPLLKDPDGEDLDVHTYRSMIGSLMYLTSSKPDITFAVNDVVRLQALIDRKKVIIIEVEALRLDNAESIDCLPNEEIFTKLSRMGAQVGDLSSHTTKYSSPALIQKVFANMRRVGKGFFVVETPLFEGMIVAQQADDVADEVAAGVDVMMFMLLMLNPLYNHLHLLLNHHHHHKNYLLHHRRIEHLEQHKIAQALEITKLKQQTGKLERKNKVKVYGLRRLKKVQTNQRIESFADTVMDDQEDASK